MVPGHEEAADEEAAEHARSCRRVKRPDDERGRDQEPDGRRQSASPGKRLRETVGDDGAGHHTEHSCQDYDPSQQCAGLSEADPPL